MPSFRTYRDKRNVDFVAVYRDEGRDGSGRTAPLVYLFRSPSWIRIGRTALDEESRHTLAEAYPQLALDWDRLKVPALRARGQDDNA